MAIAVKDGIPLLFGLVGSANGFQAQTSGHLFVSN
jgi:hypothetical protein